MRRYKDVCALCPFSVLLLSPPLFPSSLSLTLSPFPLFHLSLFSLLNSLSFPSLTFLSSLSLSLFLSISLNPSAPLCLSLPLFLFLSLSLQWEPFPGHGWPAVWGRLEGAGIRVHHDRRLLDLNAERQRRTSAAWPQEVYHSPLSLSPLSPLSPLSLSLCLSFCPVLWCSFFFLFII